MRLIESRTTLYITYTLLGLLAFIALFPVALLVLNSVKAAPEIVQSPLSLPATLRWDTFTHAWEDARFGRTLLNSAMRTGPKTTGLTLGYGGTPRRSQHSNQFSTSLIKGIYRGHTGHTVQGRLWVSDLKISNI